MGNALPNRRSPRPKPPRRDDPNQGNLFTQPRAFFANLSNLAVASWAFQGLMIAATAAIASIYKDLLPLFPHVLFALAVQVVLAGCLCATDTARSAGLGTGAAFVLHAATNAGAATVVAFLMWQVWAGWDADQERQAAARAAAEARRAQIGECETQRKDRLARLRRKRTEAENLFNACVADFNANRTIFTSGTAEQRCRPQQEALDTTIRHYRFASAKRCNPDEKK